MADQNGSGLSNTATITININDINVVELEEEVELSFNTKDYLPKDFNPYKGMRNDNELDAEMDLAFEDVFETLESGTIINIESLKGYELEEEVEIGFDTKKYLPENFDPYAGKDSIDWNSIELYELEEEVEIGFDTKKYIPKGFNPYKGMSCEGTELASSH